MGRLRVAILTNYPADLASFTSGVETVTAYLLEGINDPRHDFELHVVSLSKAIERDRHAMQDGIEYHFLAVPKSPLLKPHLPYNMIKCVLLLHKIKPDLVHCQDNVALALAAAIAGFPRLFTIHGIRKTEAKLWKGRAYWSHQADRIIEWLVHRTYRYFIGASPYVSNLLTLRKHAFLVPNPVSRLFFECGDEVFMRNAAEILFIGSLIHIKQVHILITAYTELLQEFPQLRLNICGGRDDEEYFQNLTKTVSENRLAGIHFFHDLPASGVINFLKTASMLVLPSIQENSPMTIAEAMAAGTPVIATRVGGIPYMIEHNKTGLLFRPGNIDELVACIRSLLVDKALAEKIRIAARNKARDNYQSRRIADRTMAIYRQIISAMQ